MLLKSIAVGGVLCLGMIGCGEAPKPLVKQLKPVAPIVMKFPVLDPVTGSTYDARLPTISSLVKLSKYGKYRMVRRGTDTDIDTFYGADISQRGEVYSLSYIDAKIFRYEGTRWIDKTVFKILEKKEGNTLTYSYPTSATYFDDGEMFGGSPVDSIDKLDKDARKIFSKIKNLSIHRKYVMQGSIDSKYSMDDVYSNFKRLMHEPSPKDEELSSTMKSNYFSIEGKNGERINLKVEIYNHRGASKVNYQATLYYEISPNGSTLTKSDVENYRTKILNVIND